jgi:hypothetical protein
VWPRLPLTTLYSLAVIVAVPAERPLLSPLVGTLLLTVATAVFEELQDTLEVMFLVLLSLYKPVAMNCCVVCCAMVALPGKPQLRLASVQWSHSASL